MQNTELNTKDKKSGANEIKENEEKKTLKIKKNKRITNNQPP